MKKFLFLTCLALLMLSANVALAADKGGLTSSGSTAAVGGFSGPGPSLTSAKDAATMRDDTSVLLRGNIVQHLGKDNYLFKDASGTIQVEIDHDKWRGLSVSPTDTVELQGEVDKDRHNVKIDVHQVTKVK